MYIYQIEINTVYLYTVVGIIIWVIKADGKILIWENMAKLFKTHQILPARIFPCHIKNRQNFPQFFNIPDIEPQHIVLLG